jgi:hypothetical protein
MTLTSLKDSDSYSNLPRMAPKLDCSHDKLTHGDALRKSLDMVGCCVTLQAGHKMV